MATLRPITGGFVLDYRIRDPGQKGPGRRERRHLLGISKREAEAIRDEIRARLTYHRMDIRPFTVQGLIDDEIKSILLSKAADTYLSERRPQIAAATYQEYRYALMDLLDCFGDIPAAQINSDGYTSLVAHLQKRFNPTSVNMRLRSIRAFFNWLVRAKILAEIPFTITQVKTEQPLPKFITPAEMELITAGIDNPGLLATYRVYLATGIRLRGLHRSRLEGGHLHLLQKGGHEWIHPAPLDPSTTDNYHAAMTANAGKAYSPSFITHKWTRYRNQAGVTDKGKTVHALRHTFALNLLVRTGDIYLVKEALGHSSITVTEVYLKFPRDYLQEIFGQITH